MTQVRDSLGREIARRTDSTPDIVTGVIWSINANARLVTVSFNGTGTDTVEIPKISIYNPQEKDVVLIAKVRNRMYAIGALGSTSTESVSPHNHDGAYVNATGDTMTGFLTLNADPTADMHAATKYYVDNNAYPFFRQVDEPTSPKLGTWWYSAEPL